MLPYFYLGQINFIFGCIKSDFNMKNEKKNPKEVGKYFDNFVQNNYD